MPQKGTQRWARAVWSAIVDPGDVTAGRLLEFFGPEEALERLAALSARGDDPDEITIRDRFRPFVLPAAVAKISAWALRYRQVEIGRELDQLFAREGNFLIPGDDLWPQNLDTLGADKPLALWVLGRAASLKSCETSGGVALVGSRSATRYGLSMAAELGYTLSQKGIWVISGGAYGIDAAAHRGALGGGGKTVSVQAGGLGDFYPAMNSDMFAQILETGVIVSELSWSRKPQRHFFLSRNRLISGLSQVVVVVEAGRRSGAVSTANHGIEQGRGVAAVPGLATSAACAGCHALIREGAALVTCAEEVQELMQPLGDMAVTIGAGDKSTDNTRDDSLFSSLVKPEAIKVFEALPSRGWRTGEDIARKLGWGLPAALSELGLLVLDGKVELQDGRYRRKR